MTLKQISIQDVISLNPCERYSVEFITHLFNNRDKIDRIDILNMDILDLDKIWIITHAKLISNEQMNNVKKSMLEMINPSSKYYLHFQTNGELWKYAGLHRYLIETTKKESKEILTFIEDFVVNSIKSMVD